MKPNHFLLVLAVGLLALGAASVGPWAPSPFTARTGTNTTAAAWRTAIGASATTSGSLTNMAMVGGSETGVTNSDLTASRVVVSSSAKVLSSSSATATEAGYLSGVTSAIQTQLDSKPTVALTNVTLLSGTNVFTGTNTFSTNTVFGTNIVGDFVTVGSRLRTIYQTGPTNFSPLGPSTAATQLIATVTFPPLLSTLSVVTVSHRIWRTNSASEPVWTVEWRANATNGPLVASYSVLGSGAWQTGLTGVGAGNMLPLINCSSRTEQWVQGGNTISATEPVSLGWNTLATTNVLYMQLINTSATGTSAVHFASMILREVY